MEESVIAALPVYQIAVRKLVRYCVGAGDINYRFKQSPSGMEGLQVHQMLQKRRPEGYEAEVYVKDEINFNQFIMKIAGRIDGVLKQNDSLLIEEIKSSYVSVDELEEAKRAEDLAQAKVYAWLYMKDSHYSEAIVRMTYFHLRENRSQSIDYRFLLCDLQEFYEELINVYGRWQEVVHDWSVRRDESLRCLQFPFQNYRRGQLDMAKSAYCAIRDKENLYVQAATGTGKTIGAIFPAFKAIGEKLADKVFFLTAKTVGRRVAEETVQRMINDGTVVKSVSITAKEKACFLPGTPCDPDLCPYAKDYYSKVKGALQVGMKEKLLDQNKINAIAQEFMICPFQFSLDLAEWADLIIADYNYAFDPFVALKDLIEDSFFKVIFLVDEAHNLVSRARESYSADIEQRVVMNALNEIQGCSDEIENALVKVRFMLSDIVRLVKVPKPQEQKKFCDEIPRGVMTPLKKFTELMEKWLAEQNAAVLFPTCLQLFFAVNRFLKIRERYDDSYRFLINAEKNQESLRLHCLDPSAFILEKTNKSISTIFFSATITPFDYFQNLIEGGVGQRTLDIASPFSEDRFLPMIDTSLSTKYKDRDKTLAEIAERIFIYFEETQGNVICFFPSYQYLQQMAKCFEENYSEVALLLQDREWGDVERNSFLDGFQAGANIKSFAVMGSVFSEGIDLPGDRLKGVVIVGVGLPMVCLENQILKDVFDLKYGKGYEYAYLLPGFHKVLQTVGRVIRTEKDIGSALLIDDRYGEYRYQSLFPAHWRCMNIQDIDELIDFSFQFWIKKRDL